ncbi:hypothetical protein IGS75_09030 [Gluconobacter sphaericus]|uniref:hypothetical protein n=1 Tax=Gluconobacter sphaericus TaxID=574987 RepID=UPI001921DF13|nr:hypothetical protein [Gluconobacter sphaericus]QQX90342.1 hypothetical protein IGS75_09030 [Gluconobacter sphaericus]
MDARKRVEEHLARYRNQEITKDELKAVIVRDVETLPPEAVEAVMADLNAALVESMREVNAMLSRHSASVSVLADMRQFAHDAEMRGMERAMRVFQQATAPTIPQVPAPAPEPAPTHSTTPWPDLIDDFLKDRPGLSNSSITEYRRTFAHMRAVMGDKAVGSIVMADLKAFADFLRDKPNPKNGGRLNRKTIVRHLGEAKRFLKWCISNGLLADHDFDRIQAREKTAEEKMTRREDVRRPFTEEELQRLFDSPLFTGYKSHTQWNKPGRCHERTSDFWFITIAALTGARPAELAEAPAKLHDLGGILCLDLREAGRKTHNSPRLVPIIPCLRRVGFLEYAAAQERAGRLLLDDGKRTARNPEPRNAGAWSKRIGRYFDAIGFGDNPELVLYSLRHAFRQMLRASGINEEIVNKVFGHETGKAGEWYGRTLAVGEARQVVEHVRFPVHLDHLLMPAQR